MAHLFRVLSINLPLYLKPIHLGDLQSSIRQAVAPYVMTHIPRFGGILLAWWDAKPHESSGAILWEYPQILVSVDMTALFFCPCPRQILTGTINYVGDDYLSLIVFNEFKAQIILSDTLEDQEIRNKTAGEELEFAIESLEVTEKFLTIYGSIKLLEEIREEETRKSMHSKPKKVRKSDEKSSDHSKVTKEKTPTKRSDGSDGDKTPGQTYVGTTTTARNDTTSITTEKAGKTPKKTKATKSSTTTPKTTDKKSSHHPNGTLPSPSTARETEKKVVKRTKVEASEHSNTMSSSTSKGSSKEETYASGGGGGSGGAQVKIEAAYHTNTTSRGISKEEISASGDGAQVKKKKKVVVKKEARTAVTSGSNGTTKSQPHKRKRVATSDEDEKPFKQRKLQ
eukprot:TRINITY_DN10955_c0_g1_i1.p1 TRINITY_DN10955_c0_g1~~TRINITY_DN10955_c0_g1_i1.p1  ORF type:complete len:396 (-),score=103.95 TRINITY_DN10955_c0_g1_i1:24-1211(-)